MINSWSFSSLSVFEQCPLRAKFKFVDKIPEPGNQYSSRGIDMHNQAEAFVKGELPELPEPLAHFKPELSQLMELYPTGNVKVEEEWAHDRKWGLADWRGENTWLRLKLDFFVLLDATSGLVIDLKSGRKSGNEIKHAEQGQLYTGSAFIRYPQLEKVTTEFWYLDQNDLSRTEYTPKSAAKAIISFDRRAKKMTSATEFKANPSIFTCKYCAYRPASTGGTGDCKVGVGNITLPKKRY